MASLNNIKLLCTVFVSGLILASCTNNQTGNNSAATDSLSSNQTAASPTDTMCFRRLAGTKNQDTTYVKLIFAGNKVSGNMSWVPFEKDSRKGTIKGKRSDNTITAIWTYMQEGMKDSLHVSFKTNGNKLMQQEYGIDATSGREVLEANAPYSIEYTEIDCTGYDDSRL